MIFIDFFVLVAFKVELQLFLELSVVERLLFLKHYLNIPTLTVLSMLVVVNVETKWLKY